VQRFRLIKSALIPVADPWSADGPPNHL